VVPCIYTDIVKAVVLIVCNLSFPVVIGVVVVVCSVRVAAWPMASGGVARCACISVLCD